MKIAIPERNDTPPINLYGKILTAPNSNLGDRAVLLLVPGGPGGNHTVFNSIQEELLQYGDLILFDPRGCGYSDLSDTKYCSIDHYIEDIEAIRQRFNLPKIILFGGSYGAMAAAGYAVKYGENLEKLILLAGAPSYHFIETAKINLEKKGTPKQIAAAQDLFSGTFKNAEHFKEYYQITASLYLFKQNVPPTIKPNVPYNIAITNFGFRDFLRKFNFEEDLKKIQCKTLILVGRQDWINDPVHSKVMADNIPNAQLIIFNECGHFVWIDQREKFFLALNDFLIEYAPRISLAL